MEFSIEKYNIPSPSFLKKLLKGSPRSAIWEKMNPKETTAAQRWANAVEKFVLEREWVGEYYVKFNPEDRPEPDKTFRSKVNKEWKEKIEEEAGEKEILTVEEWELLEMAHEAVWRDQRHILEMFDKAQEYVEGSVNGMAYRGYADKVDSSSGNVLEMKCINPKEFRRTALKDVNMWDMQGVAYLYSTGGKQVYYLAVDPKPPFNSQVFMMERNNPDYLNGMEMLTRGLVAFYACKKEPELWDQGLSFWDPLPVRLEFRRWMED